MCSLYFFFFFSSDVIIIFAYHGRNERRRDLLLQQLLPVDAGEERVRLDGLHIVLMAKPLLGLQRQQLEEEMVLTNDEGVEKKEKWTKILGLLVWFFFLLSPCLWQK